MTPKMTPQKAIDELSRIDVDRNYDSTLCTAIDEAVEALEREIPKPVKDKYRCPSCGSAMMPAPSYCEECGQHLKWG